MESRKRIDIGTLNIVAHPHSHEIYLNLIQFCRKHRIKGFVNKSRQGHIGTLSDKHIGEKILHGQIFFYKSINVDEPWLDIKEESVAENDDLEAIIKETQNFKPEFKKMGFVLDATTHYLHFERFNENRDSFSPAYVQRFFNTMLNQETTLVKFGKIDVTTIPKSDSLDRIFEIHGLRKLTISLSRPNPDDLHEAEAAVLKKMEEMNVSRDERVLTKQKDTDRIEPDEEIKTLAEIAKKNGFVKGDGHDDANCPVSESTKYYPRILHAFYCHLRESRFETLINFVLDRRDK